MAGNLTRDEAAQRSRLLTVHSYDVELDLTTGPETFRSTTLVRFTSSQPGATTFAEIAEATCREADLNGTPVTADPHGRITLAGLEAENTLRVVADFAYSGTGQGLHRFVDPVDDRVYLHSQFATADAQRVFACFDQPDLKARYTFTVTAPADWEVVSNSPETAVEPVAQGRRWRFAETERLSTYLAAIVAGPYHVVSGEYRGEVDGAEVVIPLRTLCRQSLAPHFDAEAVLDVTRQGFGYFQSAFGMAYPFGKYDQAFVPEFNLGAMENPGCVTFTETYVFRSRVTDAEYENRAATILHEMSHMWFGDLVTMQWWDDLWLNESFATYAAASAMVGATRWSDAWVTFADNAKARAYRQDQLSTTHPIAADIVDIRSMEVNFDAITYHKGASVLKQLVATIGQETFWAALRRYFARHAWGTATLADLLAALTEETGREMNGWAAEWLQTTGPNTLHAEFTLDESGTYSSFAVLQTAPPEHPTLRSHRIAIGLYDEKAGAVVRRHRVELEVSGARTEVLELIGQARADLVLVNDDDLTYAKVRLDDASLALVTAPDGQGVGRIGDPLAQAVCWTIVWDMVRDAQFPPGRYVDLVLENVGTVPNAVVRRTLLNQAVTAAKRYLEPSARAQKLPELAAVTLELARAAGAGSPEQLAYVRAFAASALAPEQLDLVEALLEGTDSETVPGLVVDTDLRWSLLLRLATTGRATQERIDAELQRDLTDKGRSQAAACSAARPAAEAKSAAWKAITSGTQPLGTLQWALTGLRAAEHGELVHPFTQAYFDVLVNVAAVWPSERTQAFAEDAYPAAAETAAEALALTEQYLAEAQPPSWLRRLVLEGRDELVRVQKIQGR
ncbi:aminopeptidase N [Kineosporia sp. NBRC 101677]|uniref:aminopeptidase N n=1 Tax=Kineosporia sp. NBRC 101677 TaxID=3032197 RepID=UPI0024A383D7|nr:aminopeptidase N [Kineosporia sp. NBRC 101677]GLY16438.1 aminopeptidase N [Kineosporia sp. NBRC 101677]